MADNLRRSLVPPALVLLLGLGWTVLGGPAWAWSVAAVLVLALPLLLHLVETVRGLFLGRRPLSVLRDSGAELPATAIQVGLAVSFLVDYAQLSIDAAGRTPGRPFFLRRRLLEWGAAASTAGRLGKRLAPY